MDRKAKLFSDEVFCRICDKPLGTYVSDDICPRCREVELFSKVRDYIRANDVTERDVATHFDIPLIKVKEWIRDGRIEYKEEGKAAVYENFCVVCGKGIPMGNMCSDCMRKANRRKNGFAIRGKDDSGTMRFNRD